MSTQDMMRTTEGQRMRSRYSLDPEACLPRDLFEAFLLGKARSIIARSVAPEGQSARLGGAYRVTVVDEQT